MDTHSTSFPSINSLPQTFENEKEMEEEDEGGGGKRHEGEVGRRKNKKSREEKGVLQLHYKHTVHVPSHSSIALERDRPVLIGCRSIIDNVLQRKPLSTSPAFIMLEPAVKITPHLQ